MRHGLNFEQLERPDYPLLAEKHMVKRVLAGLPPDS
jgi:hypothetical protein